MNLLIAPVKVCQFSQNVYSFVHTVVDPTSSTQVKHLKWNGNHKNVATSTPVVLRTILVKDLVMTVCAVLTLKTVILPARQPSVIQ